MDYFDESYENDVLEGLDFDLDESIIFDRELKVLPKNYASPRRHAPAGYGHIPKDELKAMTTRLKWAYANDESQWDCELAYGEKHASPEQALATLAGAHYIAVGVMARVAMEAGMHLKVGLSASDPHQLMSINAETGWILQSAAIVDIFQEIGLVLMLSGSFLIGGPRDAGMARAIAYSDIYKAEVLWDSDRPDPTAELREQL